jgi:hypothetical protein
VVPDDFGIAEEKRNGLRRTQSSLQLCNRKNTTIEKSLKKAMHQIIELALTAKISLEVTCESLEKTYESMEHYFEPDSVLNLYLHSKNLPTIESFANIIGCNIELAELAGLPLTAKQLNHEPRQLYSEDVMRIFDLMLTIENQEYVLKLQGGFLVSLSEEYIEFLLNKDEWRKAIDFCASLGLSERFDQLKNIFKKILIQMDPSNSSDKQKIDLLVSIFNIFSTEIESSNVKQINEQFNASRFNLQTSYDVADFKFIIHMVTDVQESDFDLLIKSILKSKFAFREATEDKLNDINKFKNLMEYVLTQTEVTYFDKVMNEVNNVFKKMTDFMTKYFEQKNSKSGNFS